MCFPVFREQQYGTLIVVNSLLGEIAVPQMGAYATSKWGQLGLVRTLQLETRDERHIHVCLVNPGSVNTPIYYQAANFTGRVPRPPMPIQQPDKMARHIVRMAEHPRRQVAAGPVNLITIAGFRFLPFVYERIVGPLFRLAALTDDWAAPAAGNTLDRKRGRGARTRPLAASLGLSGRSRPGAASRIARADSTRRCLLCVVIAFGSSRRLVSDRGGERGGVGVHDVECCPPGPR